MLNVLQPKAGIVSCSGEELATLKVLHELRPGSTVTICLPLFLAGGEGDREFARFHPTITIDGCDLRCAARGTEMYSGKPAASIVVNELVDAAGLPRPEGRRCLNAAGRAAVDLVAERVAQLVDELARGPRSRPSVVPATAASVPGADPTSGPDRSGRGPAR